MIIQEKTLHIIKYGFTFYILLLFTIHMFIYLWRQGCPLLTQIKQKNGRSKAISQATLPVLKWTICSKVYKTIVVLSHKAAPSFLQYLFVIRRYPSLIWKGYVCCCFLIKHKKATNVILLCHTKMSFCHRFPLVSGDLGFSRVRMYMNT